MHKRDELMFCLFFMRARVCAGNPKSEKEVYIISSDPLLEAKNRCHAVDRVSSISVGPFWSSSSTTDRFVGHLAAVTFPSAAVGLPPPLMFFVSRKGSRVKNGGLSCRRLRGRGRLGGKKEGRAEGMGEWGMKLAVRPFVRSCPPRLELTTKLSVPVPPRGGPGPTEADAAIPLDVRVRLSPPRHCALSIQGV